MSLVTEINDKIHYKLKKIIKENKIKKKKDLLSFAQAALTKIPSTERQQQ